MGPLASKAFPHLLLQRFSYNLWSYLQLVLLFAYFFFAVLFYYFFHEDFSVDKRIDNITDGFYYSIVTFTTVGFGDITPDSKLTKSFACIFVVLGTTIFFNWFVNKLDRLFDWMSISLNIRISRIWKRIVGVGLLSGLLIIGTISFMILENNDLVDSIYLSIVSASTVGYGDKHFNSRGGRWFACFWTLAAAWLVPKVVAWFREDLNVQNDVKMDQIMALRVLKKLEERGKTTEDEIREICLEIQAEESHIVRIDDLSSHHGIGFVPTPDTSHQPIDTSSFSAMSIATEELNSTSHRFDYVSAADTPLTYETSDTSLSDHSSDDTPLPVSTNTRTPDSTSHTQ